MQAQKIKQENFQLQKIESAKWQKLMATKLK